MSAPHTPGPWSSVKGTTTGRAVVAYGQPKVRFNVANVGGPNREANARLIAAAPELLQALLEARAELEAFAAEFMGENYNNLTINAAIAKAKGEQA